MNRILPLRRAALLSAVLMSVGAAAGLAQVTGDVQDQEYVPPPVPRYREGGTPQQPADQRLTPYAIDLRPSPGDQPPAGLLVSPPEYAPTRGVLYRYFSTQWSQVVTDCVAALTKDPNYNEIAYVVVTSASQQSAATTQFTTAGADMSKVVFITAPGESVWIRDYGPHFITQDGVQAIVDSHYYPSRPQDNFIPTLLAEDFFKIPKSDIGLYYSGGNFQPTANRNGFVTALINLDNPASEGFTTALIEELYETYQGIDVLHIMPQLPFSVDGTGHIDMWMYLIDEDSVIISEFIPGSNPTAIQITNNAVPYMQALGYSVFRPKAWNSGSTHYTYTNAYRVNNRIFIPFYGTTVGTGGNAAYNDEDAEALAIWQAAAPGLQIVPIQSNPIIPAAGAIHCIVMQVPAVTGAAPTAVINWPRGGEVLNSGATYDIRWGASDDQAVTSVDLYYSTDDGQTFPHVIALNQPNSGKHAWTVPATPTGTARVRVVARDAALNVTSAMSGSSFAIVDMKHRVYDFSSGANVDKFGYGYQKTNWAGVESLRLAVNSNIETLKPGAYAAIASSNATGNLSDPNRYISPTISSGNRSVTVYEFSIAEDPADIACIDLLWEGYADRCTQAELYVWNNALGNWGNAAGQSGQNRYLDNAAANRDATLRGSLVANIGDYITSEGKLTLLVFAERVNDETFHDYLYATVVHSTTCTADIDGDGVVGQSDLGILLAAYGQSGPVGKLPGDLDKNGTVDQGDLGMLLAAYGGPC